jgi:hypothetical protein
LALLLALLLIAEIATATLPATTALFALLLLGHR